MTSAPASVQRSTVATGSSDHMVSRSKSPCVRRTQRPPRRSMAGITWNAMSNRGPAQKVAIDLKSQAAALLRVELGAEHVVAADRAREGNAVLRCAGHQARVRSLNGVGVDKIEVAPVGDVGPGPRTAANWTL